MLRYSPATDQALVPLPAAPAAALPALVAQRQGPTGVRFSQGVEPFVGAPQYRTWISTCFTTRGGLT